MINVSEYQPDNFTVNYYNYPNIYILMINLEHKKLELVKNFHEDYYKTFEVDLLTESYVDKDGMFIRVSSRKSLNDDEIKNVISSICKSIILLNKGYNRKYKFKLTDDLFTKDEMLDYIKKWGSILPERISKKIILSCAIDFFFKRMEEEE